MRDLRVGDKAEVWFAGRWSTKGIVDEMRAPESPLGSGLVRIGVRWFPRSCVRRAVPPDERLDRPAGYVRDVRSEA